MRISHAIFPLFVLAMIAASCNSKDPKEEPVPDELLPGPPFMPQEVVPNSNFFANHEKVQGYVLWPEATIDDSNLQGEGYFSYEYWSNHISEAQSFEGLLALCQVPQSILNVMSTRNLVLTCFKHPYSLIYTSYDDEYMGVMTIMTANSYQELMRRQSGSAELLDLFCKLKYGNILFSIDNVALTHYDYPVVVICLITAVDCNVFDQNQVKRLAIEALNQIDAIIEFYSGAGDVDWRVLRYPYLLGAILTHHNDMELQDNERELLYRFLGWQGLPSNKFTWEEVSNSTRIISESLERLVR